MAVGHRRREGEGGFEVNRRGPRITAAGGGLGAAAKFLDLGLTANGDALLLLALLLHRETTRGFAVTFQSPGVPRGQAEGLRGGFPRLSQVLSSHTLDLICPRQ